jgi:hypothetical protein
MLRRLLFLSSLAAVLLHLTSCNPERRLANNFVKKREPASILLLSPEFSYKYNFKVPDVENFDSLSKQTQDSLLFFNSELLQYIDDSLLITNYLRGLSSGLKSLGFNVFTTGTSENFVNRGSDGLIVNVAQLELEEFLDSISDNASFGDEEHYNYDLYITAVNINSWLELTRVNHQDSTLVLYASNTLTDRFDGGFRYFPFTGEVKYDYTIDSLTVEDIHTSVISIGNLYAGLLFDYLMNDYILRNLATGTEPSKYYTWDRFSGTIRKSKGQRLTRLK